MATQRFWTDSTVEPKRAFRYFFSLESNADASSKIETYAIKSVKKPSFSVSEVPHQYVAHTFYYPGRVTWNPVDITFVDPVIPDQTSVITNMFIGGGYSVPTQELTSRNSFSKGKYVNSVGTPKITQIDADGQIIETWTLNNAFITTIDYGQLDYSSEDLVILSVTLRYDFATFTTTSAPGSLLI
tara:strand:- start:238 stop:792 length:555 start_codon:yes stop_codon:yes gene_type:complete